MIDFLILSAGIAAIALSIEVIAVLFDDIDNGGDDN